MNETNWLVVFIILATIIFLVTGKTYLGLAKIMKEMEESKREKRKKKK